MILRFGDLLWSQLNGPQANALIKATSLFFRTLVQPKIDYFYNLDVKGANSAHLNLFGVVLGVPRPLVWNTADPYWTRWFRLTEEEVENDQGFSDPDDPLLLGVGGLLHEEYQEYTSPERIRVDTEKYRAMLQAATSGVGEIGSLALLDKFVSIFFLPEEYQITQPPELNAGDVLVSIYKADEIAYTAVYAISRLWLPNTHVIVNVEV